MLFVIGLLAVLSIAGAFSGFLVYRRLRAWPFHYRIVAAVLPFALCLLGWSWTCEVLRVTDLDWNQARLAPLIGLKYGYSLYYPAEDGPVMGAIYGPISYFAYFPSLLAATPVPALLIGSVAASLYFFAPVAWIFTSGRFRRKQSLSLGLLLFTLFGLWTIQNAALRYTAFGIHADAPALGFGAAACALLMKRNESRRPVLFLVLAALSTVLAISSKQSIGFVVPIFLCFLWAADGKRSALQFAAALAVLGLAAFGLFSFLFSARALYFNMFAFPSHHGFGGGSMQIPDGGIAAAVKTLIEVGLRLWSYSRWILLPAALCYILELRSLKGSVKSGAREWIRHNRWVLFHLVALGAFPISVIFGAKVGGDINAFSLHLYFSLIGLLLLTAQFVLEHENLARPALALCLLAGLALLPTDLASLDVRTLTANLWTSNTEQVYQYEKVHPGETYFAAFTLPVLMAEGRMYHFEYGVFDRDLGQARVSQEHFMRFVPPRMKYLQRKKENSPVTSYLPEFSCPATLPEFSAVFSFYSECPGQNAAR